MLTPAALTTVAHVVVSSLEQPLLDSHDFHHVTRVLRARPGEALTVTDGRGSWRAGVVPADWSDPSVAIPCTSAVLQLPATRPLCVGIGLVKADKPETVVQKLTEAGIARIVFLSCTHSVVKWDNERAAKHLAKLKLVAREALMQSRGVWMPVIEGPVSLSALVASEHAANRVIARADVGGGPLTADLDTIVVGPEGGWSPEEQESCPRAISLGNLVYRAETAAIGAAVLLSAARAGVVAYGSLTAM